MVPTTSADFDRAYRAPITFWGDFRIPAELAELARSGAPRASLELGCGLGRFSRYVARQGIRATAVDFSPVAIERARDRVKNEVHKPELLIGDVTNLEALTGPYDMAFDVGCFHCLGSGAQGAYASEVARLVAPGRTHLIWALDHSPAGEDLSPYVVERVFAPAGLRVEDARPSRRRLARSHWYWLTRTR